MRNYMLNAAMLLTFLFASRTESAILVEPTAEHSKKCDNRSLEEIVQIAQNAPMTFEGKGKTRNGLTLKKELDLSSITGITNQGKTRTSGEIDTLLYAINYADNDGYVIVSSKKGTPGVIAYVEEGEYDLAEMADKSSDIGYVTQLASEYVATQSVIYEPIPFADTLTMFVGPLLETAWGQHDPEGIYCPNGIAGCSNTAMAQIMAYYEYPETLQLTYDDADGIYQVLDWSEIKKHKIRHTIPGLSGQNFCIADTETHNAIGRLCRQLGELNCSDYWRLNDIPNPDGTSADCPEMYETARMLGFTIRGANGKDWEEYNSDTCLLEALSDRHPIVMTGIRNDSIGHMWVVDGYLKMTITEYLYAGIGQTGPTTYQEIYNHVNWGWDGRSNGYFLSNIFNVGNIYRPDPNVWGPTNTSNIYNEDLRYLEFYRDLNNIFN